MKAKFIRRILIKSTLMIALIAIFFSCKKNPPSPDNTGYNLNVTLTGENKTGPKSYGYIEFRQDPDTSRIIDLNTWVYHLEPNHSYQLQRAVNPITDPGCSSTAWLTLGLGLQPQDIVTDEHGNGNADLWRAVTTIARGTQFHIHFQIIDAATQLPVLASDCYDYTVR
jgi:hypothetical protein